MQELNEIWKGSKKEGWIYGLYLGKIIFAEANDCKWKK